MLSPAVGDSTNEWKSQVESLFTGSGWSILNEPPNLVK